jgi:hypothetical protein
VNVKEGCPINGKEKNASRSRTEGKKFMILGMKRNNIATWNVSVETNRANVTANNLSRIYNYSVIEPQGCWDISFKPDSQLGSMELISDEFYLEVLTTLVPAKLVTGKTNSGMEWEGFMKRDDLTLQHAYNYRLGEQTGKVYYGGQKGTNFINGIGLWVGNFENAEYRWYEVGLGRKGIFLCIYRNNALVAIAEKGREIVDYETHYLIYADDSINTKWLFLICTAWDLKEELKEVSASKINKKRHCSYEGENLYTWQEEAKNKYCPDFIQKIKAQANLPETADFESNFNTIWSFKTQGGNIPIQENNIPTPEKSRKDMIPTLVSVAVALVVMLLSHTVLTILQATLLSMVVMMVIAKIEGINTRKRVDRRLSILTYGTIALLFLNLFWIAGAF